MTRRLATVAVALLGLSTVAAMLGHRGVAFVFIAAAGGAAALAWSTTQQPLSPEEAAAAEAASAHTEQEPEPEPEQDMEPGQSIVTTMVRIGSAPPATATAFEGDLWALFGAPDPIKLWLHRELAARGWSSDDTLGALAGTIIDILRGCDPPQLTALTGREIGPAITAHTPEPVEAAACTAITRGDTDV